MGSGIGEWFLSLQGTQVCNDGVALFATEGEFDHVLEQRGAIYFPEDC